MPKRTHTGWHVYILRCGDGTLYTGIAVDVEARFERHAAGRGARYTRGRGPLALLHVERAGSHGDALRREAAIRRLGRAGKEALVAKRSRPERETGREPKPAAKSRGRPGGK